jgi:hypothetical protein
MVGKRVPNNNKENITRGKKKAKSKSNVTKIKAQNLNHTTQVEKKRTPLVQHKPKSTESKIQKESIKSKTNIEQNDKSSVRRYSFIVRLTIEGLCKFQRVEIEQVPGIGKRKFLKLDGEQLASFMKECIGPMDNPKTFLPLDISDKESEDIRLNILRSNLQLVIKDISLFHPTEPNHRTFTLMQNKPFIVNISFTLIGADAEIPTKQETGYEIKIYGKEITKGTSELLTKHYGVLRKGLLEYIAPVEISGLTLGVYRLFTIINLNLPTIITAFKGKTLINII